MIKKGKEIKLKCKDNFKITYGSIDNTELKALYINISSWLTPKDDSTDNFNRIVKNLNKEIKQWLYNHFCYDKNDFFIKERTIVDLDIKESCIRYNKKSFANCEITLYPKILNDIKSDFLQEELNRMIYKLLDEIFKKNKYFDFYKRK